MKKTILFLSLIMLLCYSSAYSQDSQTFLSLKQTGVEEFLQKYPEYDGRGTIVFIFDTGVDMGIPGLTKTSTGEVKVIDVQDFTGQGDVKYTPAEKENEDGVDIYSAKEGKLKIKGKVNRQSSGDYYIGSLNESMWKNSSSGASDINNNGKEDEDFIFIVFPVEENGKTIWVMYLDSDGDGNLDNEKEIRTYRDQKESVSIVTGEGLTALFMGVNFFPGEDKVNFHFDDGAHGTHCAGIAAGNKIGDTNLNGVAPGAYVISCKLGNNNYSGGATVTESMKKCYDYADSLSKVLEMPCVINMSFGIGSEIEGMAVMEKYLEKLAAENPYLYICVSNSNEGPGISTTGLPSGAKNVFSSGAVLTKEVGADLYGATLENDIILYFSSRGGELMKPDIISPGACTSTVPNWGNWDRFWGTSMASPYSAGVMSLLLSAAKAKYPDIKIPSQVLFAIVKESATVLPQYKTIDQGAGYINVDNAFTLLEKYIKSGQLKNFETYTISSLAPNMPGDKAPALYLRDASWVTGNETFTFSATRDKFGKNDKFYRSYTLKSEADWLIPMQKNTYLRNDQPTMINVKLDKSKMQQPGLYNAKIKAYRTDFAMLPEFEVWATAVIPYEFNTGNNFTISGEGELAPGMFDRYYFKVTEEVKTVKISMNSIKGKYQSARYILHDPDGKEVSVGKVLTVTNGKVENRNNSYYNLIPGVYELVVEGYYQAKNKSTYQIEIIANTMSWTKTDNLSADHNQIYLTNSGKEVKAYKMSAELTETRTYLYEAIKAGDTKEISFEMKPGDGEKTFELGLSKEDFGKLTDFAFFIQDEKGKTLESSGMSYIKGEVSINPPKKDSAVYKLVMVPAFAENSGELGVHITEKNKLSSSKNLKVTSGGKSNIQLYPMITEAIQVDFSKIDNVASKLYGKIYLKNNNDETEFEIPISYTK